MSALPFLGAALPSNFLAQYADWLKENQRDLEIQDPIMPEVLDGDWRSLVKNIKSILDGYTGRMGVHGPFLSLTLIGYDPKIRQVVVDRLLQSLEICGELGATHMVVHSPIEFFGTPFLPSRPDFGHPFESQLIAETMMPVVAKAEQIGTVNS
ncbi:MAG UNVERIFIED_CONTAM: sugar phosphate isomerase/epimerase [Anaerolineae bacterium]|jgi:sugar phosphate isomerase/epimerase